MDGYEGLTNRPTLHATQSEQKNRAQQELAGRQPHETHVIVCELTANTINQGCPTYGS